MLGALGGLVQINPIWLYGPYEPYAVSTAAQPDWYMGWLEGALRLMPAFQLHLFGYRVPEIVVPAAHASPLMTFGRALSLARYRQAADAATGWSTTSSTGRVTTRSALPFGAAVLTFYIVLFVGGSQDIIAQKLRVSIESVTVTIRILIFALPAAAAAISYILCQNLRTEEPLDEASEEGDPPVAPSEPPLLATTPDRGRPVPGPDD